jgi:hypothetical protein
MLVSQNLIHVLDKQDNTHSIDSADYMLLTKTSHSFLLLHRHEEALQHPHNIKRCPSALGYIFLDMQSSITVAP